MSPLNQESEEEGKDIDQEEDVVVEEEEVEEDKTEEEKQENESVEEERKKHSKEQEDKQVIGSVDNLTVKLRTNNASFVSMGGILFAICHLQLRLNGQCDTCSKKYFFYRANNLKKIVQLYSQGPVSWVKGGKF